MNTEDDTFLKLKRAPFSEVWKIWLSPAIGTFETLTVGLGWSYEEFSTESRHRDKQTDIWKNRQDRWI